MMSKNRAKSEREEGKDLAVEELWAKIGREKGKKVEAAVHRVWWNALRRWVLSEIGSRLKVDI